MNTLITGIVSVVVTIAIIYFLSTSLFAMWIAKQKGYSQETWFVLGLFFGVQALLAIGFAPDKTKSGVNTAEASLRLGNSAFPSNTKKCPVCANDIKADAKFCRNCGTNINEYENQAIQKGSINQG